MIQDIQRYFRDHLQLDMHLFRTFQMRPNLRYRVVSVSGSEEKKERLLELITQHDGPKIVYVSRTRKAEDIAKLLNRYGHSARAFHGKMDRKSKMENQDAFMDGEVDTIVATTAFGMGVDKDNVVAYLGETYESAKSDERKEFKWMIDFVKKNKKVSYIIVYAYDRFSRTGANGAYISEQLKKQGIVTLYVTQEVDPNTASGTFRQNLYYMFSQFDNQLRKDRMVTGFQEKLLRGYWPLPVPIGYTNLNRGKRAEDHKIVVDQTGKFIRKAWHWKLKHGLQNKEIVERLCATGVNMSQTKLSKIFHNPFYCGLIVSTYIEGQVIEGKHEAMVSKETFFAVVDLLKGKFEKGRHSKENESALPLRRFVRCSECGEPYTGCLQKQKGIYYYRCRTKGCCKNRNQRDMHSAFENFLESFEVDPSYMDHVRKMLQYVFVEQNKEMYDRVEVYRQSLQSLELTIEQLEERFARGEISSDIFQKYHEKFEAERATILENIDKSSVTVSNLVDCIEWVVDQSKNLSDRWESSENSERVLL